MNRSNERIPSLTIVLPVRNRAGLVRRTLDSIASQNVAPEELIIVDNGSTDNTMSVLRSWADSHSDSPFGIKVLNEPLRGASRARNLGLGEVSTEYVMFFDSDDLMEHDHLERVTDALRAAPDCDILHWAISYRDSDGWTDTKESHAENGDLLAEQILHSSLGTLRYCVRTSFIRNAGGWNENLSTWDDYELGIRMLLLSPKTRYLNGTPRVIANRTEDSLTGPTFSSRALQQKLAIEEITSLLAPAPFHRLLFRAKCAVLAANYRREGAADKATETLTSAMSPYAGLTRMKLRFIYMVQLIAGRGASSLAAILFPTGPGTEPSH